MDVRALAVDGVVFLGGEFVVLERNHPPHEGAWVLPGGLVEPGEWDDHDWSGIPHPHESPKEQRTDPSTVHRDGNVASGDSETG